MPAADFDVAVIGAGAVGLAIAQAIATAGGSVLIVERAAQFGTETSARNSEVIHAGIYYPPGSLKARLCVEGRELLYAFCTAHDVSHRRCGKLIVATDERQIVQLEAIKAGAASCGVHDLDLLDAAGIALHEPAVHATAAVLSPSTGIIDSHEYMQALLGIAEAHGAILACHSEVAGLGRDATGWTIRLSHDPRAAASADLVINAAGLGAVQLAQRIADFPAAAIPHLRFAKGSYFGYSGAIPFSHLIYPLPEPGGLGTHLTLDMAGRARFGPDVEWIATPDYHVAPTKRDRFAAAVRRFWPGIDAERLQPDYAGVRPKLSGPGEPAADFMLSGPSDHGVAGIINLFGIESPGLTASLAIAREVSDMWQKAA